MVASGPHGIAAYDMMVHFLILDLLHLRRISAFLPFYHLLLVKGSL